MNYRKLQCGPCEAYISTGTDPVCEQVCPFLNKIIVKDVDTITPLVELALV